MKTIFVIVAMLFLLGCKKDAQTVTQSSNSEIKVELLFEHDGCKVYRFYDGRYVYWSDCRGSIESSHTQSNGKSSHTVYDQTLNN